jgi:hypothetical protein
MNQTRKQAAYAFWDDYGWSGPLTAQQTGEVNATLLLYNRHRGDSDGVDGTPSVSRDDKDITDKDIMYER